MTEQKEETTESIVNGDDILDLARKCPLLLPVSSDDVVIGCLPDNKKNFTLAECYALLECDTIDVVRIGNPGMILIVDDNGAINSDPQFNEFATILYRHHDPNARAGNAHLFGKTLLCPSECLK